MLSALKTIASYILLVWLFFFKWEAKASSVVIAWLNVGDELYSFWSTELYLQ